MVFAGVVITLKIIKDQNYATPFLTLFWRAAFIIFYHKRNSMNILISAIQVIVCIFGLLAVFLSILLFLQFRWPAAAMWGLKVFTSSLSPVFVLVGAAIFVTGLATGSLFIEVIGAYVILVYLVHYISVTRQPAGEFEKTFSNNWETTFKPGQKEYFLSHRTSLRLPRVPKPRFDQDITFATIPGIDRKLLCDVWQPAISTKPSGVAFIYIHGSAFYFLDKDCGTRPLFRQLAAQGHVIMDVAHRLAPETDLVGMIHDIKRAIAWMKSNAEKYAIDTDKVIVAGGSSGGYLALMTAFTSKEPEFTPADLEEHDLNVCSVVALYPATDLEALYYHTNQHLTTRSVPGKLKKKVPADMPAWMKKWIGKDLHRLGMDKTLENVGTMPPLMGGHPDECPERYKFFSPITHVHYDCPPTLLIHGAHDIMAPVKSTRLLYDKLIKEKIQALLHILPQADHAFDLFLTNIAPAAHNAIYDVERFIALISNRIDEQHALTTKKTGTSTRSLARQPVPAFAKAPVGQQQN